MGPVPEQRRGPRPGDGARAALVRVAAHAPGPGLGDRRRGGRRTGRGAPRARGGPGRRHRPARRRRRARADGQRVRPLLRLGHGRRPARRRWRPTGWSRPGTRTPACATRRPGVVAVEEVAARWLLQLLGLPAGSAVGFATGATMANFTCLAAARGRVLERVGWDVAADGLAGAPRVRVLVGAEGHGSVDLALRYLGLGAARAGAPPTTRAGWTPVPSATRSRERTARRSCACRPATSTPAPSTRSRPPWLRPARRGRLGARRRRVRAVGRRVAVARRADRRGRRRRLLGDRCAQDAQHALRLRHRRRGRRSGRAPRRWACTPATCSPPSTVDPLETVPEISRRARGVPVWAALASLGSDGVRELVDGLGRGRPRASPTGSPRDPGARGPERRRLHAGRASPSAPTSAPARSSAGTAGRRRGDAVGQRVARSGGDPVLGEQLAHRPGRGARDGGRRRAGRPRPPPFPPTREGGQP